MQVLTSAILIFVFVIKNSDKRASYESRAWGNLARVTKSRDPWEGSKDLQKYLRTFFIVSVQK